MASTAQVCLPYSGVEKEKKMRRRAVRTLPWCKGKRMGRRAKLYGAPSSNSALACKSRRSEGEMPNRITAPARKTRDLMDSDADRSLA